MTDGISKLRKEYSKGILDENNIESNPFQQFRLWFEEALSFHQGEANAMTLATVNEQQPSIRIVLLKGYDEKGFVFFSNYQSAKGMAMERFPLVAINFFWGDMERQVRIEGKVEKVSEKESDEYFNSRPRGSQLGAWASPQSSLVKDREELDKKLLGVQKQFGEESSVPRPKHWGGYRVIPHYFEFWQGRPNRLHDRLVFSLKPEGQWVISRLAP